MKYILVTGCVISGLGKGIITSSIGTILKGCGLSVTAIKIDPYLNIDAGTFSPFEHGEVFVLDDGGEVDLDLGNYERFLDVTLHHDNNITTGKIYKQVIERERRGDYLGKTVQVVPHITDAIQEWVERVAVKPVSGESIPQICVIELGGTIGDIEGMPFIEAFRSFQFRVSRENFMTILVSLVPEPVCTGEQKTKPTQNAVRELRGLGLSPDLIACRSARSLTLEAREKVAHFCHVLPEQVLSVSDCDSLHRVPLLLLSQRIIKLLSKRLNLQQLATPNPIISPASEVENEENVAQKITSKQSDSTHLLLSNFSYNELMESSVFFAQWQNLALRQESPLPEVHIALVGKYTRLQDSYLSVSKAIQHAALYCKRKAKLHYIQADLLELATRDIDPVKFHDAWQTMCSSQALIVPGGFGQRGTEGKIEAINWARTHDMPFLGVCLGMQLAAIEFARNKLGLADASSSELQPKSSNQIIIEMPEFNPVTKGGTMRLGKRRTIFTNKEASILWKLYGKPDTIDERHRHRYEINPEYVTKLESEGMKFVGCDIDTHQRMEIMELKGHSYFVGCQYHPEYLTRPLKPSPPYLGLILAATHKLDSYCAQENRTQSPSNSLQGSDFSSWPLEV